MSTYVFKIGEDQIEAFKGRLLKQGSVEPLPTTNPYEAFRAKYKDTLIIGYTSGKIVANNPSIKPLVSQILKDLGKGIVSYDIIIGSDEAGKGEWLGPLTIAAVALSPEQTSTLRMEGVMDSKELKLEKIMELNEKIKEKSSAFHVITITPRRFNQFLQEMKGERKSLNDILAWGHARAIDKVYYELAAKNKEVIVRVVIDEFDRLKTEKRLQRVLDLKTITLIQKPEAEEEVAVAAAGILAKATREVWIDKESSRLSFDLRCLSSNEALKIRNAEFYVKRAYLK